MVELIGWVCALAIVCAVIIRIAPFKPVPLALAAEAKADREQQDRELIEF